METIFVSKAEYVPSTITRDCRIFITQPIPDFKGSDYVEKSLEFYEKQASKIVDALQAHLPGGTLDAVLRELCKRKACLFRGPI